MRVGAWERVPFLEAVSDESRGHTKVKQSDYLSEGALAVVDQGQDLIGGFTDVEDAASRVELPAIIFGDHTRAVKFIDFPFAVGADGVKVLKARPGVDTRYLYRYLQTVQLTDGGYSRHFKYLKEIDVPLPPIEEQRRIAAVLDAADALRAKRREALAKLDTLTKTMFAEAQSTASLGQPVRLAELAERVTVGHVGPASESFVEHGVPFIRTGDILRGRLDLSATRFVSESFHDANQKSRLQPGDVVITRVVSNELRAAVVPESITEANCGDVVVVRPGHGLDGAYLVGLLHQPRSQAELLGRRVGSSHLKVNTKVLQNWEIRLPSADGLATLAAQLDSASVLRRQFESSLSRLESLFSSLQQRAFRGQL